jgi:hypothetical protein
MMKAKSILTLVVCFAITGSSNAVPFRDDFSIDTSDNYIGTVTYGSGPGAFSVSDGVLTVDARSSTTYTVFHKTAQLEVGEVVSVFAPATNNRDFYMTISTTTRGPNTGTEDGIRWNILSDTFRARTYRDGQGTNTTYASADANLDLILYIFRDTATMYRVGYDAGDGIVILDTIEIMETAGITDMYVGVEAWNAIQVFDNLQIASAIELAALASNPNPPNGSLHGDTWVNLSWRAGAFAVSHDIYIGDNFDDVNTGAEHTFQGNQTDEFIVAGFPGFPFPDGLVPGTTYYWRVDEVNDTEPNSPWKGEIWSFSIPPKTAYFPDPADEAEGVSVDVELSWNPGFGAKLHTVYFGETFDEVDNADGGQSQGTTTFNPGTLKMAGTYYWRVDEFDIFETHKGDIWSFITEGGVANPRPAKGAVDVTQTPILTWTPGLGDTHEVYFGTDASTLEKKADGSLGSESYEPGQLEWNTTYYWRVDEANSANYDSPWTGPLWSFTTANFLIIDDMESYNDIAEGEEGSNRIYLAWVDGYDNPALNGSVVGNDPPPIAEQNIVHSGLQSMPMAYDNAVGKSEATLTLTSNRDWTVNGVDTLTIWFRGEAGNAAEQMYVTLNGNSRVDHDDPDAATLTRWTEWIIDLQAFGVNLTNVNSITLGLSSVTGGIGKMYFDDIRLYPTAP